MFGYRLAILKKNHFHSGPVAPTVRIEYTRRPMKTENTRQLTASILGIDSVNGQRTAVMIPEGATVTVLPVLPAEARMVGVLWNGRTVAVFAEDLGQRGKDVKAVQD